MKTQGGVQEYGEKEEGELEGQPSITALPFLPLTPPHPTLNCPCNELPVNGFACVEALEEPVH